MKTKLNRRLGVAEVLAAGLILQVWPGLAQARIGETEETLVRRMVSGGHAILYSDELFDKRLSKAPYAPYLDIMPDSAEVLIFFKRIGEGRPSTRQLEEAEEQRRPLPGWDLHVVLVAGRSVLEYYDRGRKLTEPELNGLLALQKGDSHWERKKKGALDIGVFPFEMVRASDGLRAQNMGRGVLFVAREFDEYLARALEEKRLEEAPESLEGF